MKKMEIVIFLGTGPQNHLFSLWFISVFAMGSSLQKSEFCRNGKSQKVAFYDFHDFDVKSAISRKMGSRAPGTPKSTPETNCFVCFVHPGRAGAKNAKS